MTAFYCFKYNISILKISITINKLRTFVLPGVVIGGGRGMHSGFVQSGLYEDPICWGLNTALKPDKHEHGQHFLIIINDRCERYSYKDYFLNVVPRSSIHASCESFLTRLSLIIHNFLKVLLALSSIIDIAFLSFNILCELHKLIVRN